MARATSSAAAPLLADAPLRVHAVTDVPRTADGRVDVLGIARRLDGSLLESSPTAPGTGRHSYVVASAAGRLVHVRGRTSLAVRSGAEIDVPTDPFEAVDLVATATGCQPRNDRLADAPFATGLVGLWAHDLARFVERVAVTTAGDRMMPDLDLLLADAVVVVDHATERATLLRRTLVRDVAPRDIAEVTSLLARDLGEPWRPAHEQDVTTSLPRSAYRDVIGAMLDHIGRGDIFQANVGQRLTAAWDGDLASLYAALRAASPAPFGAMHRCGDGSGIASISPETFLIVDGRQVQARPIKGTRPRAADRDEDERRRQDLLSSAKDRAENVMIVDLLRNDLGRVCVPGTIQVPALFTAEAHPTVWQLVSTVRGRLRRDVSIGDLLRAAFPCGSVTGAPKVRAMELIEAHEPVRRGPWCGAFGFVAPGAASLSVTIRTAALDRGRVDYAAGGGIVADSDPDAEIDESWDKAAAFLTAVRGRRPAGS